MTTIVLLHNYYDQKHLDDVVEQMRHKGAPTIRAYDLGFDDLVQAIDGCHRLRACEILHITPIIEYLDPDTQMSDIDTDEYDLLDDVKVGELGDWENHSIDL